MKIDWFPVFLAVAVGALGALGGAGWGGAASPNHLEANSAVVAVQNATETQTPGATPTRTGTPSPTFTPARPWDLYMSSTPLGEPKTEFPAGITRVHANFFVSDPTQRVRIVIRNRTGGDAYNSGELAFTQQGWHSVTWAVPEGQVIPTAGSPYLTNLYRVGTPGPAASVEWTVGTTVYFHRDTYYGTSDFAVITVVDFNANVDSNQQETVQVHVWSDTDTTGFSMSLKETSNFSGRFTTQSAGKNLTFCSTTACTNAASAILQVADLDTIYVGYDSVQGTHLEDTATWQASGGPVTNTPSPTVGPSPTPSLTPTPTLPPQAVTVELTPAANAVGYFRSQGGDGGNYLGGVNVVAGVWAGTDVYLGALQFDLLMALPPQAVIHQASLEITGKTRFQTLASSRWRLRLLDPAIDPVWTTRTYTDMLQASFLATIGNELSAQDFTPERINRFHFQDDQVGLLTDRLRNHGGKVSFRLDGPRPDDASNSLLAWYTGNAIGEEKYRPRLRIVYNVLPPTHTPTLTPTPSATPTPTGTPTVTPTVTSTGLPSPTTTATPTASPTATTSPTGTPTATETATPLHSPTPTETLTPTVTPTETSTATASPTPTPTWTPTSTATPCPDGYEPDDTREQAQTIMPNQEPQRRSFHRPGDVDFLKFPAMAGHSYTIRTSNLAADVDTVLSLYAFYPVTQTLVMLGYSDDDPQTAPASRIDWTAPQDGTYYLEVVNHDPLAGGCSWTYEISVVDSALAPTTTLTPSATATPSATITPGATPTDQTPEPTTIPTRRPTPTSAPTYPSRAYLPLLAKGYHTD